jgi:hypothetical protein
VIGGELNGVERALKILATVDQPVLAGLRDSDGRWVGILGGWQEADNATVFLQMNHERENLGNSLSLVLRGYLIERLIESGVRTLRFWAGTRGGAATIHCPCPYPQRIHRQAGLGVADRAIHIEICNPAVSQTNGLDR